jgi:hypothetical protein
MEISCVFFLLNLNLFYVLLGDDYTEQIFELARLNYLQK